MLKFSFSPKAFSAKLFLLGYDNENHNQDPPPEPPKTFTQEEVNAMLATEKRGHQSKIEALQKQLGDVKTGGLSAEQRQALESQIAELNNSLLTKEEQAKRKEKELADAKEQEVGKLKEESNRWKSAFEKEMIKTSILNAGAKHKAYGGGHQLLEILENKGRVISTQTEDAGEVFSVKIKLPSIDDKGKPIVLDLDPDSAVEYMKTDKKYLNLFESNLTAGLGGSGTNPKTTSGYKLGSGDFESYLKNSPKR